VAAFDFERDGDLDLYLANDFGANSFYQNNGDGTFRDITEKAGVGDRGSGMNVDVSDLNGDGEWDIYVTNIDMFSKRIKVVFPRDESTFTVDESLARSFQYLSGNKLYVSQKDNKGSYLSQESTVFEPGDRGWGWDAVFFDYDNDGDDDMYMLNGWVDGSYAGNQANQMYVQEKGFFYRAPEASPESFKGNSRSLAAADFDLDGDIDVIVNNHRQAPRMLVNKQTTANRWIELQVQSAGANRAAIGAVVEIIHGDGSVLRQVLAGRGYLSQGAPSIHAGVGNARTVVVKVRWPDGKETEFPGLASNQRHVLRSPGS
jgi:hypothetical protein